MQHHKFIKSCNKNITLMAIIYLLTYMLLICNYGIFWDDWTVYNVPFVGIDKQFFENGYIPFAYILKFIFSLSSSMITFRILIFIVYLLIGIIIYKLLLRFNLDDNKSSFIIALLFITAPLNFARISIVNINHAINLLMFLLASYFMLRQVHCKLYIKLISLILFFLSFFTPSILVFYSIFILAFMYNCKESIKSIKELFFWGLSNIAFVLWPIIFWICRDKFFKPHGLYAGYNGLKLNPSILIKLFAKTLNLSFYQPLKLAFSLALQKPFLVLVITVIIYLLIGGNIYNIKRKSPFFQISMVIAGLVIFLIGSFAYISVGKVPQLIDWESRQQLLLPLGFSLIIYYSTKLFLDSIKIHPYIYSLFYSIIISLFVSVNISIFYQYQLDSVKISALAYKISINDTIKNNNSYIFSDNYKSLNTLNRTYRFYEYTGLMKYSFKNTKHLAFSNDELISLNDLSIYKNYEQYNIYEANIINPQYKITINPGKSDINFRTLVKFHYYKLVDNDAYYSLLNNLIELKVEGT